MSESSVPHPACGAARIQQGEKISRPAPETNAWIGNCNGTAVISSEKVLCVSEGPQTILPGDEVGLNSILDPSLAFHSSHKKPARIFHYRWNCNSLTLGYMSYKWICSCPGKIHGLGKKRLLWAASGTRRFVFWEQLMISLSKSSFIERVNAKRGPKWYALGLSFWLRCL